MKKKEAELQPGTGKNRKLLPACKAAVVKVTFELD